MANITGKYNLANFGIYPYCKAEFHLSAADTDADAAYIPDAVSVVIGSDGSIDAELWENDNGTRGTVYTNHVVVYADSSYQREVKRICMGKIVVIGDAEIQDLLVTNVVPSTQEDALALAQAAAASAENDADRAEDAAASAENYADRAEDAAASAENYADRAEAAAAAALYDGPWLDTVAALLADTTLTYTAGQPGTVAAGDYVRTRAEGFAYQVAASGATNQHVTTAGGVKLYVQAGTSGYNVKAFGAKGDGVTNDTTAFTAALGAGSVYAPAGTYLVNIVLSTGDHSLRGDGIEDTILKPTTAANPVIKLDGDLAGANISFFSFSDFSIEGNTRQGDGLAIANTSDLKGCDHVFMRNVRITACAKGIACRGRSIWNSFENVFCDANYDGIFVETDMACNTWTFTNCRTAQNRRHGLYAYKTSVVVSGFIDWTFINFNTEYNGQDTSIATIYGFYANGAEGWSLQNVTSERPGQDLPGVTSYGFFFDGPIGRSIIIDGVSSVEADYCIAFADSKKSGYVNNAYRLEPYAGGFGVYITANWFTDEPKIELGPNINGTISVTYDGNGNYPITQGVDYYSGPQTSLSLKNKKSATINTGAGVSSVATITGLLPGDTVFLYNFGGGGANNITLAAGLMVSGVAYNIAANSGVSFKVLGFPEVGKLVPL